MRSIFLEILEMSLEAGALVCIILLLRIILRRASKRIFPVLWGIIGLRLIIPYHISVPIRASLNGFHLPVGNISEVFATEQDTLTSQYILTDWPAVCGYIWLSGMILLILFMGIIYVILIVQIHDAVLCEDHIYQSEHFSSPFIVGIIQPKIILPYHVSKADYQNIISHEKAHLKRLDHITKLLAFVLLSVHWFNPFIWIAFLLFSRDVELACDERVIKEMTKSQRADYAQTLLNYMKKSGFQISCTLTFGGNMKKRIISILGYQKATVRMKFVSALMIFLVGIIAVTEAQIINPPQDAFERPEKEGIIFADFDRNNLRENEYLCSLHNIEFKIELYDDSLGYECIWTFSPDTPMQDVISVSEEFRAGWEKQQRAQRDNKTINNYNKKENMEKAINNNKLTLLKYIESIASGR